MGEFIRLSYEERKRGVKIVIEEANGKPIYWTNLRCEPLTIRFHKVRQHEFRKDASPQFLFLNPAAFCPSFAE